MQSFKKIIMSHTSNNIRRYSPICLKSVNLLFQQHLVFHSKYGRAYRNFCTLVIKDTSAHQLSKNALSLPLPSGRLLLAQCYSSGSFFWNTQAELTSSSQKLSLCFAQALPAALDTVTRGLQELCPTLEFGAPELQESWFIHFHRSTA